MWLIPGKTKVQTEIFKGVSLADILIGIVAGIIFVFLLLSNLPYKFVISIVLFFVTALLLVRIDAEPNYVFLMHMLRYIGYPRRFSKIYSDKYLISKNIKGEQEAGKERPGEHGCSRFHGYKQESGSDHEQRNTGSGYTSVPEGYP